MTAIFKLYAIQNGILLTPLNTKNDGFSKLEMTAHQIGTIPFLESILILMNYKKKCK